MKSRRLKKACASRTRKSRSATKSRRHRKVPSGWLRPGAPATLPKPDTAKAAHPFASLDFPDRHLLYPHELADRLGCCIRHVYDLIAEGQIRALDISGSNNCSNRRSIRIPIDSWRKFLSERTV